MIVKMKSEHPDFKMPLQASAEAAGADVYATEIIKESEDTVVVHLGFSVEFPKEFRLMFTPRSSFTKTKWILQNSPGIGDADYRGEYKLRFRALPNGIKLVDFPEHDARKFKLEYPEFPYKVGERVAQMYFANVIETNYKMVDELNETERGSGGFGSTGNK